MAIHLNVGVLIMMIGSLFNTSFHFYHDFSPIFAVVLIWISVYELKQSK